MELVKGHGLPFPAEYSSCSNISPKSFHWTNDYSNIEVYIDNFIKRGLTSDNHDLKYGWLCESREIGHDAYNDIINRFESYESSYKGIFTCDYSLISVAPEFFIYAPPGSNIPWTKNENMAVYKKSKLCSMIASPKAYTYGHHKRLSVASKYKDKLDLYGGAHGSIRIGEGLGPNSDWWRSKSDALNDYMFSVVFENAVYDKYYTEKITDCFATGTVPIYWGTRKIVDDFNSDGIIFFDDIKDIDFLSEELYNKMLPAINDNLNRVKLLELSDDIIYKKINENRS